jgi:dihydroxyacetone kinase-like protein
MRDHFTNAEGRVIVDRLVDTIHKNRAFLSEIDGRIGDGDHGINMDKGFQLASDRFEEGMDMSEAMRTLGRTLLMEIGGSMGPLYGQFFKAMAKASKGKDTISTAVLADMLEAAYAAIRDLGGATPGDKTIVDTLDPAVAAIRRSSNGGEDMSAALDETIRAAEAGWRTTEDMVAKIGRSSRLGERSRGVLDAGATSCYLILETMAETIKELIG